MNTRVHFPSLLSRLPWIPALALGVAVFGLAVKPAAAQESFPSAEEAARALVNAEERNDTAEILKILGPGAKDLITSGDKAQDEKRRADFVKRAKESLRVAPDPFRAGCLVVSVGKEGWPLPIHLVKAKDGYRFDIAGSKLEILARRIGRNELNTIEALRLFTEAEREYAYSDLDRDGMRDYARLIISTPGKHDGLYWEPKAGEPESPLAKVFGNAVAEGYKLPANGQPPIYHGYVFRVLKAQGPEARGGARDYVVRVTSAKRKNQEEHMIGGFAFVAYPAEYGNNGVKTFLVNQDGVVFEKDLGPDTRALAVAMKRFNPDKTWREAPRAE